MGLLIFRTAIPGGGIPSSAKIGKGPRWHVATNLATGYGPAGDASVEIAKTVRCRQSHGGVPG